MAQPSLRRTFLRTFLVDQGLELAPGHLSSGLLIQALRKQFSNCRWDRMKLQQAFAKTKFAAYPDEDFVIVGVTRDMVLNPRSVGSASIHVYHLLGGGERLELVHKTPVDEIPSAICPFMGRILIGVGRFLRLYDLGKKKLLKKCENKHIPTMIVDIQSMGTRIVVSDVQESCHFLTYKRAENQLVIFECPKLENMQNKQAQGVGKKDYVASGATDW